MGAERGRPSAQGGRGGFGILQLPLGGEGGTGAGGEAGRGEVGVWEGDGEKRSDLGPLERAGKA